MQQVYLKLHSNYREMLKGWLIKIKIIDEIKIQKHWFLHSFKLNPVKCITHGNHTTGKNATVSRRQLRKHVTTTNIGLVKCRTRESSDVFTTTKIITKEKYEINNFIIILNLLLLLILLNFLIYLLMYNANQEIELHYQTSELKMKPK